MPRVVVVPAGMLALALTLGACSDGPSVSSQAPYAPPPATSAPSGPDDVPSDEVDPGTGEETPSEGPSDDAAEDSSEQESGTDRPSDDPDDTGEEPTGGAAPTESPTTPPPAPDEPAEPTTETPTTGNPDDPDDARPGGDDIRTAADAARTVYPGSVLISVVHLDDNSGQTPPPDTGFVVVLVAGPDRVEVNLDAGYRVTGENATPADDALLALSQESVIDAGRAIDRAAAQGVLDGKVVRSIELVDFSGSLTWDIHVFGTSERVASIDAGGGGSESSSQDSATTGPAAESATD